MTILHYSKVDIKGIESRFTKDKLHRLYLKIPFLNRTSKKYLCIIGQNPSDANEFLSDKTLSYIEEFVFKNMKTYSGFVMLNLYSRVDTKKAYKIDLERDESIDVLKSYISDDHDFLIIYGKLKNEESYKFLDKAKELKSLLKGKKVFKINIGSKYPPHPGNPKILYKNILHGVSDYSFLDII